MDEPTTWQEAIKSKNAIEWKKAMDKEMNSLEENQTWKLVEKPSVCEIVDSK